MKRYQTSAGRLANFASGLLGVWVLSIPLTAAVAQPPTTGAGGIIFTPANPTELPVEIEVETGIASLKQAPLWKELVQMLEDPYLVPTDGSTIVQSAVERRPGFGATMPPLNVWPLGYNFLTAEPLRIKPSDGEISWDQPGPMFDPEEVVFVSADPANPNVPDELRSQIGALVVCSGGDAPTGFETGDTPCAEVEDFAGDLGISPNVPDGWLVVHNPAGDAIRDQYGYACETVDCEEDTRIPANGTIVGVPAVVDGVLYEAEIVAGEFELEPVTEELEMPVNEVHFITDRYMAEVLGKALFWDMQVGSDGVQACGSCHFHAGVDNRTRNQLNPNIDNDYEIDSDPLSATTSNFEVTAADFPFHKRRAPDLEGDGADPDVMLTDANDVMASMGVSRFTLFEDVIVGQGNRQQPGAFSEAFSVDGSGFSVAALVPDVGTPAEDPIEVMQGVRRIEPRNTPTIHGAAFNLDNFWDARARFDYNGGSVFGPSDPFFHVYVTCRGGDSAIRALAHPAEAELEAGPRPLCDWTEAGGNYLGVDEGEGPLPIRIKFSSLGSQAMGPPLSNFEMAFDGRNWAMIGKKLLQNNVVPLANQLVAIDDSRLGPWSNQGGAQCLAGGLPTAVGMPGLCISYRDLIRASFRQELHQSPGNQHLAGTSVAMNNACDPGEVIHEEGGVPDCDPFDGYVLEIASGPARNNNTNQFTVMEANFSLFFGLSVQAYESLTIPDDTPFDRFMDANPFAGNGVGQPGEQGVLYPTLVPNLVRTPGTCPTGTQRDGALCLVLDDLSTDEYDGFGAEELFGFDIFAGANLTAALTPNQLRNPDGFGSNPFTRTARCMLCHLGPEQTDHSINISHGLIKGDAEFEFPTPQSVIDPFGLEVAAPEPPGPIAAVGGLILAEEVEETPQDAVEVEPMNFAALDILLDDPTTHWLDESTFDDSIIGQPSAFSFGDQGIYNVGLRPIEEDIGRGADDPFGWPLSRSALTLMNIGGEDFEPCDNPYDAAGTDFGACAMANFNPSEGAAGGLFEELDSDINPGYEREPINPRLPEYLAEWVNAVPAGELHPSIDEMAGFAPNTITVPNGGPAIEFGENMFGADLHCGTFDPAQFGTGSPNFSWGPSCPNNQSGVPGNILVDNILNDSTVYVPGSLVAPLHGTWPFSNRVRRDGQFKAPPLRNVELTGPYFHTGSYLTLRQVVDFYMRGGDFPMTNAENRDQHMIDIDVQVFGFGSSKPVSNGGVIPDVPFADALPDTASQYDAMPDTDHPTTPEPATSNPGSARTALVKYLLSLTDPRVKYERAPFDHPEIFVPIDGAAPENTGGRAQLLAQSGVACPVAGPNSGPVCFRQVPASGEGGLLSPLPNFLNVLSVETAGQLDHFDFDPLLP